MVWARLVLRGTKERSATCCGMRPEKGLKVAMDKSDGETPDTSMYLIGIGASAGGLEAATALAQNLPKSANAAYILAQHMSPTHKSLMVTLLSRETDLDVLEIVDGTEPKPNTFYVTPPNSDAVVEDGRLRLRNPQGHAAMPKPSADRLFESLAKECGERCMAIILSGTGSDGSYGVRAIREAGGITLAQQISTAKYDGMPGSAIDTGCIDLILSPEQMGEHLERILEKPQDLGSLRHLNDKPTRLTDLFQVLQARTQIDFRDYKENTVNRRISRRMVALGIEEYDRYVDYCRETEEEVEALHRDLLISVTRFFRDPDQFEQLSETITSIVRNHSHGTIRVWIAGCATGEEAYSIAILFAQALGGLKALSAKAQAIQIFASDIDERALEVARTGVYPLSAANDIPPSFLEKYFEVDASYITIVPAIRNMILFSRHNLVQDPPFINVDLISLRNVLIYFNPMLQERVLSRVHYALDPKGALFLGTSESVGGMHAYFESSVHAAKVYRKRQIHSRQKLALSELSSHASGAHRSTSTLSVGGGERKHQDHDKLAMFDVLARAVAPNGFIATKKNQIVRVFGDISQIIEITEHSGVDTNINILRQGLREEASVLINVALKNLETRTGRWHVLTALNNAQVCLKAYPLPSPAGGEDHVLIAIETRDVRDSPVLSELDDSERSQYVMRLEREMAESIAGLIGAEDNVWVPRGIGAIVIIALLGELRHAYRHSNQ